jgi:tetratricopeptide (TPR) repeat protein
MPISAGGSKGEALPLGHEVIAALEADAVHIVHDERFLYAACRDLKVRVWSKEDWQLVAELGETSTEPLMVHVDEDRVYATCERRVYVWKKETWGMTGWFELTYHAITSTLQGDSFYVGARDGRLVSIKKDTHETSSWQLHKSDISTLWSDDRVILTGGHKEEPRVWLHEPNKAPTELARLDKKIRPTAIVGNPEFVIIGSESGEISIWDRVEWQLIRTLQDKSSNPVVSMWSNSSFLVAAMNSGLITVWDLIRGNEMGRFVIENYKIGYIEADHLHVYVVGADGILVLSLTIGEVLLDLNMSSESRYGVSLLRTSPYDVLESVLVFQREGDGYFDEEDHQEAVAAYEKALQYLIDNTHALLEVPEERQQLTEELNERLGRALLKSKIQELGTLTERINQISAQIEPGTHVRFQDAVIDKLWDEASRAIKESRVLSDAQAGDILSYQLTDVADTLETELAEAMAKVNKYRETVNQALTLTHGLMNEWRWMERKKTSLNERKAFLEDAMAKISEKLKKAEPGSEVESILSDALDEHRRVYSQISRIIEAADSAPVDELVSKEEAIAAIEGFLRVLPKRRDAIANMTDLQEQKIESERLQGALRQALESATKFKMKEQQKILQDILDGIEPPKPKKKPKSTRKRKTKRAPKKNDTS